jgi:hypothetical protein
MSEQAETKKPRKIPNAIRNSGYERGFWMLMGASFLTIALLVAMESSRAKTFGNGLLKRVEIERISLEEAHGLKNNRKNN